MEKYIRLGNIVSIIVFSIFLLYINDLEKKNCVCSEDWERESIKYYSIVQIRINTLLLFLLGNMKQYLKSIIVIMGLLYWPFLIITLVWIGDLKDEKCECSDGWKRSFMEIYSYVVIVLHALIIILKMIIVFMFFRAFSQPDDARRVLRKFNKKRRK